MCDAALGPWPKDSPIAEGVVCAECSALPLEEQQSTKKNRGRQKLTIGQPGMHLADAAAPSQGVPAVKAEIVDKKGYCPLVDPVSFVTRAAPGQLWRRRAGETV